MNNEGLENDLYMEDVHDIALETMEMINARLNPFNITLTNEQEDAIYIAIENGLENVSNGYYRHEN